MIGSVIKQYAQRNKALLTSYVTIVVMGVITSFFLIPKFTAALMSSLNDGSSNLDTQAIVAVVVAWIFVIFVDMTKRYLEDTMVPEFTRQVRSVVYEFVMNSHKSDRQVEMGKLLNIIGHLPYTIRTAALDIIRVYFPYYVAMVVLIIYFFSLNKTIGCLQLGTILVFVAIIVLNTNDCVTSASESMENYLVLSEKVKDKVSNIDSVYASQQEGAEIESYDKSNAHNSDIYRRSLRKTWRLRLYEEIVIVVSFIAFNALILKQNLPKKTTVALYVAEMYYFMRVLQTSQSNIVGLMVNVGGGQAMVKYLEGLSNDNDDDNDSGDSGDKDKSAKQIETSSTDTGTSLELNNISFRYSKKDPWILRNLNLKINHGDRIWIKGNSGCGKSTLFNLILGGLEASKGTISLYGNTDTEIIRNNTSLVDQHTKLFNTTVLKNIMYGNDATETEVRRVLAKLGTNIYDKLPKGLRTKVGVDGDNLSGGQKALTVLLRCYFRPAKLVLFDEPISAIDEENVPLVMRTMTMIAQNRTMLVISHNNRVQEIVNKVVDICKVNKGKK